MKKINSPEWDLYVRSGQFDAATEKFESMFDQRYEGLRVLLADCCPNHFANMTEDDEENNLIMLEFTYDVINDIRYGMTDREFMDCIETGLLFNRTVEKTHPERFFSDIWGEITEPERVRLSVGMILNISLNLNFIFSDYFIPWLFAGKEDSLDRIASKYSITLPPRPSLTDFAALSKYYHMVNDRLIAFAADEGITVDQLCAFLFDFNKS